MLDSKIFVAGHRGLVGSAIVRALTARGAKQVLTRSRTELDLLDQHSVRTFFAQEKPEVVFLAAAKVGGILANSTYPADFLYQNIAIAEHVIDAARHSGVRKLVNLGSSCIYPKLASQPIREDSLLTGPLEPTNRAYAIAKIAAIELCDSYRTQYGCDFISAMPTNLYGPHDNFDLTSSHVLPAMIRKLVDAKKVGAREVVLWGSGTPRREFMFVEDMVDALLLLAESYAEPGPINVGTGEDVTILDLAEMIRSAVGFSGDIVWDRSKPDGTPRKLLDVSRLRSAGFSPKTSLADGIEKTLRWYLANRA
ncbi:MAG: GDP-L-fucose synthase [Clostridia bacterium]|nr:GDP-L-fucose synthase [Deltaproteobacteria bacterium]